MGGKWTKVELEEERFIRSRRWMVEFVTGVVAEREKESESSVEEPVEKEERIELDRKREEKWRERLGQRLMSLVVDGHRE